MWLQIYKETIKSHFQKANSNKTILSGRTKGATDPHTVLGYPGTPDREVKKEKIIERKLSKQSKNY